MDMYSNNVLHLNDTYLCLSRLSHLTNQAKTWLQRIDYQLYFIIHALISVLKKNRPQCFTELLRKWLHIGLLAKLFPRGIKKFCRFRSFPALMSPTHSRCTVTVVLPPEDSTSPSVCTVGPLCVVGLRHLSLICPFVSIF